MGDLFHAIGQWIEARIKTRGFLYKLAVGACFLVVVVLFSRDIAQMIRGTE